MDIRKAAKEDTQAVTCMALLLWPSHTYDELFPEMLEAVVGDDTATFLAWEAEEPVGFAQCSLRRDYVEGVGHGPAGYLEGIFVRKDFRRRGIARSLTDACQAWARERGCLDFASDCELDNVESYRFHLAIGFREVNRVICFLRK